MVSHRPPPCIMKVGPRCSLNQAAGFLLICMHWGTGWRSLFFFSSRNAQVEDDVAGNQVSCNHNATESVGPYKSDDEHHTSTAHFTDRRASMTTPARQVGTLVASVV
ncbi:hypothetical protein NDU88_004873 [Pleurodeles waltl]|uniref:Secreted protein n=1 Tax=Pleurodeles waltl TaxID=8319 RepID=A0AAV7RKF5_PLEWA|nr:hypothetical protein NDU88_004873 [Pleurodeles waltl]